MFLACVGASCNNSGGPDRQPRLLEELPSVNAARGIVLLHER